MSYMWHDGFDAYGIAGVIDGQYDQNGGANIDAALLAQGYFHTQSYGFTPDTLIVPDTVDGVGYAAIVNSYGYWAGGPGRHIGAQDGVVVGFHMKLRQASSVIGDQVIFRTGKYLSDGSYNTHMLFTVRADCSIKCDTGDNANSYSTKAGVILAGIWQRIEIKHIIGTQPQTLQIKVDGVTVLNIVASPTTQFQSTPKTGTGTIEMVLEAIVDPFILLDLFTTDTSTVTSASTALQNASLPTNINIVQFLSDSRLNMYVDHFYVLSTDGNTPCDFIGNALVRTMMPGGAGGAQQFRQIGGNLHGAFTAVNEIPPTMDDSSCIADNTAYDNSLFLPDVVPTSVIDIFAVAVTAVARGDSGGENVELTINDGTNFGLGPAHALTTSYGYLQDNFAKNPAGGYWSYADLTQLQFGVRRLP